MTRETDRSEAATTSTSGVLTYFALRDRETLAAEIMAALDKHGDSYGLVKGPSDLAHLVTDELLATLRPESEAVAREPWTSAGRELINRLVGYMANMPARDGALASFRFVRGLGNLVDEGILAIEDEAASLRPEREEAGLREAAETLVRAWDKCPCPTCGGTGVAWDWPDATALRAALAAPPRPTAEGLEQAVIDALAVTGYVLIDERSGLHGTEPAFAAALAARLTADRTPEAE